MHETDDDLSRVQALLDTSRASMGEHMASIFTDERWLDARQLCDTLQGVCVLALSTVTAAGEPRVGPVDGLFFRGAWHFGSSPESVRFRHIRARPAVSGAHTRGEELAVVVHGEAARLDLRSDGESGFADLLVEVYGEEWREWGAGAPYARIDAHGLYTFFNPAS